MTMNFRTIKLVVIFFAFISLADAVGGLGNLGIIIVLFLTLMIGWAIASKATTPQKVDLSRSEMNKDGRAMSERVMVEMNLVWRDELLGKLKTADVRAAFFELEQLTQRRLIKSPNSGAAKAMRFHDNENRYLFSFIVNNAHLLFYIRKPAISLQSSVLAMAKSVFETARFNKGEIAIPITNRKDALKLMTLLDEVGLLSSGSKEF